jgi:NitT/TauT family transport system permease protein
MSSDAIASGGPPTSQHVPAFLTKPAELVLSRFWLFVRIAAFYVALIALWQLLYELEIWSPYLFPSPAEVWDALWSNIESGLIRDSLEATLKRLAIGFALAFAVGMTIGIACGTMRWVDETLGSLVLGMQSLPSITWLPLAVLWFGLSEKAIIFVVLMGSVWAIAISARDGVRNIPPLQRRAAQVFGASRWQTVRYVTLPGMLPSMAQGLKLGWSFSWRSLMAGELLFVSGGLGYLLQIGRDLNDMPLVIAVMGVIVAVGLAFDRLVFGPLESWVRQRWGLASG